MTASTYQGYQITTGAANLLLTLDEVRAHLNLPSGLGNDNYLTALIRAATKAVETYTGLSLLSQTVKDVHDCFPAGRMPVFLRLAPVSAVVSIDYTDTAGDAQTWASSEYETELTSSPARLAPGVGYSYPATLSKIGAVEITYIAGFGATAASIPQDIIHAVKLMLTDYYENRGEAPRQMRTSAQALLAPYCNYTIL